MGSGQRYTKQTKNTNEKPLFLHYVKTERSMLLTQFLKLSRMEWYEYFPVICIDFVPF